MSNYFIFGIGGTGSRVVRSLTMLLAAGVKPFKANDKIFPILIDYDVENGDTKRATECIGTYHNIHAAAFPADLKDEEKKNYRFFSAPIMEMKEMSNQCKSGFVMQFGTDNKQKFSEWIAYNSLSGSKQRTRDILESLYYDSSKDANAELQLNMEVGFKGNPNIGSIVFHSLKETPEFADFCSLYKRSNGDKVIIVGSLFGGTGSSGIPEMVQAIRTQTQEEVQTADIAVIMVCPYFKFNGQDEKGTVRSTIFNSKTKAALNFYKASGINDMVNTLYYLGDQQPTTLPYCEGGKNQRNNSHLVDLLGAMSIVHFANLVHGNNYDPATKKVSKTDYFKYRMAVDAFDDEVDDNVNSENKRKDTLNYSNFLESELETIFYPLTSFAIALRYFHDEIARKTKNVNEADFYTTLGIGSCFDNNGTPQTSDADDKYINQLRAYCAAMMTFYSEFTLWNKELKDHATHGLNLYDFDSKNKINQFIIGGTLEIRKTTTVMGRTIYTNEENLLEVESDITELVSDAWKELEKLKFAGLDSNMRAFLLDDVLTKGCRQLFNADKPDESVKRRRILDSKLIDKKMKAAGSTTTN